MVSLPVPTTDAAPRPVPTWASPRILALGVGLALFGFFMEHNPAVATGAIGWRDEDAVLDAYIEGAEEGSIRRKAALLGFAAAGALLLLRESPKRWRPDPWIVLAGALLLAWAGMSVAWSDMPGTTIRRLVVTCCAVFGAVGLGRALSVREVTLVSVVALTLLILTSFAIQSAAGHLPFSREYRFAGTIHANIQAFYCATLGLFALCLTLTERRRAPFAALLGFALVMLVLTGSRTSLAAFLLACPAVALFSQPPRTRAALGLAMVTLLGVGVFAVGFVSPSVQRSVYTAFLMGRSQDVSSATGRLPLWEDLVSDIQARFWTGYGYESFWTKSVMDEFLDRHEWAIAHAHNVLLETMLQLGAVGLGLVVLLTFLSLRNLRRYYDHTGEACCAALLGLVAYMLVTGCFESFPIKVQFPNVMFIAGIAAASLFAPAPALAVAAPREGRRLNAPNPSTVDVTVVTPTYNRGEMLRLTLDSLTALDTSDGFTYEVVVVNNASTDHTEQVIASTPRGAAVELRSLYEPTPGVAHARNAGIRAARGAWIAFHDDDQVADPRWLAELLALARRRSVQVVGGAMALRLPEGCVRRLAPECRQLLGEKVGLREEQPYSREHIPGTNNLMVHRDVLADVGVFDTTITDGGEDADLYRRIRVSGRGAWFTPSSLVHHLIPEKRLSNDYMRWTALRHGQHVALRELRDWGFWRLPVVMGARAGQALLTYLPRYAAFRLAGDGERALGARCLLWRSEGYLRRGWGLLTGGDPRGESGGFSLNLREGREQLIHGAAAAAPASTVQGGQP